MTAVLRPCTSLFVLFLACCSLFSLQAWGQSPRPSQSRDKATRSASSPQTLILPVRYLDGSRMVRLLKVFVPMQELRNTYFLYSPSIHKLLIQAPPHILEQLKAASQQIDVPQAQFWVQMYFLKPSPSAPSAEHTQQHANLFAYLDKTFPAVKHFSVVEHVYVRTTNHHMTELKATKRGTTYDPTIHLTLNQGLPQDDIQIHFHLLHHEAFRTNGQGKINTQFIKSTQLQTRFFATPGSFVVLGSASLRRDQNERTLVLVKVDPIPARPSSVSSAATSRDDSSTHASATRSLGTLEKNSIRRVINANKNHFKACYTRALATQPTLKGTVVVSMSIQPSGHVTDTKIKSSTLRHKQVEDCILAHIGQLKFPAPAGGGVVLVNYPLIFNPR